MKMTKKILTVAVVAAALFGLAGCENVFDKEIGDVDWKNKGTADGNKTYVVNQTNESTEHKLRGMKRVGFLPRAQGTCVVKLLEQTATSSDGVVGFATSVEKNKDANKDNYGTYNFLLVGVRNSSSGADTYVSYFCNIKEEEMSSINFGAYNPNTKETIKKDSFDEKCMTPYEIELVDLGTPVPGVVRKDGELAVAIRFTGKKDGSVLIEWSGDFKESSEDAHCEIKTVADSFSVTKADVGIDLANVGGAFWTYANVYEGKTLNGKWDIYDISWSKARSIADDDTFDGFGDILFEEVK